YNTEWSSEYTVQGAYEEYLKAWFVLHILEREFDFAKERSFVFNMSVGYNLQGIKTPKIDGFIEGLKDATRSAVFAEYKEQLKADKHLFKNIDDTYIDSITPNVCTAITLSTMHGCPPVEIEAICSYLLSEKKINTLVKMNPTLLGYKFVREALDKMGFDYIGLKEDSFTHDLQYPDGVAMLKRLKVLAKKEGKEFGVKLSNTLPCINGRGVLPGDEMYMSGRALYPLTINLAKMIASEFNGDLIISFSGGADATNIAELYMTGIQPITLATTILKPGGYQRLEQIAKVLDKILAKAPKKIDLARLEKMAVEAFANKNHIKERRPAASRKISKSLPLTNCYIAPCMSGCPIGQDIPEYVRLVGEGRHKEALQVIIQKNPLPFMTGTICDHQCMSKCTRIDYDESVCIRMLKKVAADNAFDEVIAELKPKQRTENSAKVAVLGAGPAGLAAAYFLAKEGLDVTIFDKKARAGGTVEYIIPEFRIPNENILNDVELVKNMGAKFELGIDANFSIEDLKSKGFKYIMLAIGAGKSSDHGIGGEQHKVKSAIHFLGKFKENASDVSLGKNVAIIGGGNTAMDAARAAKRVAGVENVYIVYRRTKAFMPADPEELALAIADGVIFMELLAPIDFAKGKLNCQKMELGAPDASGRRSPIAIANVFEQIMLDTVISAIGEKVEADILTANGVNVNAKGNVEVNENLETNLVNVYVGGDAVSGPSTVVEAIADATKVAKSILAKEEKCLCTDPASGIIFDAYRVKTEITAKKGVLVDSFNDGKEAGRCLECNIACNNCVEVCPNRANVVVMVSGKSQVLHVDAMCNECGNCASFCPYTEKGEPYKYKFTLFGTEDEFNGSKNSGFVLLDEKKLNFKLRKADQVETITFTAAGICKTIDKELSEFIWTVYKENSYLIY
ncbi:MAG: putative selenate reductase subunit YgfK, partial [Clostridia bacterium]